MYKLVLSFSILFLISSCNNSSVEDEKELFPSDTTVVTDVYPEINSTDVINVMESLKVCTTVDSITNLPPCNNQFFRIFNLGPNIEKSEGFILEMRAGLFNTPVKQLLIIQKGFNKYQIVNQYLGFLVELRTTESGYNDLLIGYEDPDIGIVAIKHIWSDKHYEPVDVEEINGYFVKQELKDSINDIFLNSFSAGF
jgi:hypothetical protein